MDEHISANNQVRILKYDITQISNLYIKHKDTKLKLNIKKCLDKCVTDILRRLNN